MERSILARATTVWTCLQIHHTLFVGGIALHNRQILKSYMEGAGFRSYAKEWWHFKLINEPFNRDGFDFEASTLPSADERPTR
jgi:D-alanyl-D-alanine dipeptidase